jgi:hypothetical protein
MGKFGAEFDEIRVGPFVPNMGGEALAVKSRGIESHPDGKSFISRKLQNTTFELRPMSA